MITGIESLSDFSPSHLIRALEGWQDSAGMGLWRYLVEYRQTKDQFEELELDLKRGQQSRIPVDASKTIKIIHLTEGGPLKVRISPYEEREEYILNEGDCLVVGSEFTCSFEAIDNSRFDITLSQKIDDPKFWYFIKPISKAEQTNHEFLGSTAMQRFTVIVHPELLDGLLSRCLFYVAPGENGPPFHTHPTHETFRVLKGSADIEVALGGKGQQTFLKSGDYLNVFPKQTHTFRNTSSSEAQFVATLYPAGIERTFLKFSELYKKRLKDELTEEQYKDKMNEVRATGCHIHRADGAWK